MLVGKPESGLNGALCVLETPVVHVEEIGAKSGAGQEYGATCITVRHSTSAESVRVLRNDLVVGHLQAGILVVNADRAVVEDNRVTVGKKPSSLSLDALLAHPARKTKLAKRLVTEAVLGESAAAGPEYNAAIPVGRYNLHMNTTVPASEWRALVGGDAAHGGGARQRGGHARLRRSVDGGRHRRTGQAAGYRRRLTELRSTVGEEHFKRMVGGQGGKAVLRNLLSTSGVEVKRASESAVLERNTTVSVGRIACASTHRSRSGTGRASWP